MVVTVLVTDFGRVKAIIAGVMQIEVMVVSQLYGRSRQCGCPVGALKEW